MRAYAPGKLILTGEHAVVYGTPAIAIALNCGIYASYRSNSSGQLRITSAGLDQLQLSPSQQQNLVATLDQRYQSFLYDQISISEILAHPLQLVAYALLQHSAPLSGELTLESHLPTGAGMGSSAAAIAATLKLNSYMADLPPDEFVKSIQHCERLQHGKGSLTDAAAVTYGGMVMLHQGKVLPLERSLGSGWYRAFSGKPSSSTGRCVAAVAKRAEQIDWSEFERVSQQILEHWFEPDQLVQWLQLNHRLLCQLAVVPAPVMAFVERVESLGAAAKVSGAGSVEGDNAGTLLVYAPMTDVSVLSQLALQWGYSLVPVEGDLMGVRKVED